MEIMFQVEDSGLMGRIAVFFGNSQASIQCFTYGVALPVHLGGREPQRGLKMHLVETSSSGEPRERMARWDQRWHSGNKDIARKTCTAAAARLTPTSVFPPGPKHHSRAARTLLMPAKCDARSIPLDDVDHSFPLCSNHRQK